MFKAWCSTHKLNNGNNLSHVLMDGGVLSVPFDKIDEFCEEYMKAVINKEKLYVVEQKSPTYNFFLDIDYKDEHALDLEYIQKMSRIICDKVKTFGGRDCLVCVSKPKDVGEGMIKTGIHLNWPGFVVDQESAVNLRDHVVATLSSVFRSKKWNQIIDNSVYGDLSKKTKGSGFRMPWSYKKGKHIPCQGQGCPDCEHTGKITESPYLPIFMYVYGPIMCMMKPLSQEPNAEILKASIVRTDVTDVTRVPALDGTKKKEGSFSQAEMKDEFRNDDAKAYLETFIRTHMEGQDDARITKMFNHKNHFLISTTSKYCENLGRGHNSNHIWFHVVGNGIVQRCFCKCETIKGRYHGFCADFRGREHRLPDTIVKQLYPDTKPPSRTKTPPPPKQPLETTQAIDILQAYMNKCIQPIQIFKLTKNRSKYVVDTDSGQFVIDKSSIECKTTGRKYILNTKSKEILFPAKK